MSRLASIGLGLLVACGGGEPEDSTPGTPGTGAPTGSTTSGTPVMELPTGDLWSARVAVCVVTDAPELPYAYQGVAAPVSGTVVGQGPVDHEALVAQGWLGGCSGELAFFTVLADDGTTWHFGWGAHDAPLPWSELALAPGEPVLVYPEGWAGIVGAGFGLFLVSEGELRLALRQWSDAPWVTQIPEVDALALAPGALLDVVRSDGSCPEPQVYERYHLSVALDASVQAEQGVPTAGTLGGAPYDVLNTGNWVRSELSGECGSDLTLGGRGVLVRKTP